LKLGQTPATKSKAGYNYCLSQRTTPSFVKRRHANKQHRRSRKEKKTKFNLSTTNKGTKIETGLITLFDYAIKFENTRSKLE